MTLQAAGNPFYAESIALALAESKQIYLEDGKYSFTEPHKQLQQFGSVDNVSHSIERIITSRFDKLDPQQQIILQVQGL